VKILRHARPDSDTAIAVGSFDGVHRGHAALLARVVASARERGLASAVLTFEPLPREFLAPAGAPGRLTSLAERLAAIADTGIERVFVQRFDRRFASLTAEAFHERLRNHYRARWVGVGENFLYGAGRKGNATVLAAAGARLGFEVDAMPALASDGERISSTRVRAALACGDFAEARRLLGRPYSICGRVVQGDKRGRGLGFPTANLRLARPKPALQGIFAVKCHGAATRGLEGVASLGINPAVKVGGPAALEAFLFDFSGDLYGRRLSIEFLKKLREEANFASLDELAAQIRRDCDAAREFFRATGT
jgi:riboflavin kinase / FMN adenylyltransferase